MPLKLLQEYAIYPVNPKLWLGNISNFVKFIEEDRLIRRFINLSTNMMIKVKIIELLGIEGI
jgi:hypothetical protein